MGFNIQYHGILQSFRNEDIIESLINIDNNAITFRYDSSTYNEAIVCPGYNKVIHLDTKDEHEPWDIEYYEGPNKDGGRSSISWLHVGLFNPNISTGIDVSIGLYVDAQKVADPQRQALINFYCINTPSASEYCIITQTPYGISCS